MSDVFVTEALQSLEVEPVSVLEKRNKFYTGNVNNGSKEYFIKIARSDVPNSVFEDLENEVAWDQFVNSQITESSFVVPTVVAVDPENRWALFEHLDGEIVKEESLPVEIGRLSLVATTVCGLEIGREPSDLEEWYTKRLGRFTSSAETLLDIGDLRKFKAILDGRIDLSSLTAGIIHGDFNLKNILQNGDTRLGLVDAEFGSTPNKPELDKPRYHDIAYFYHLLLCQYHSPDLAEQFLDQSVRHLNLDPNFILEGFEREFHLSLLERTVSMANHFVVNRDPMKVIDDERRSEPRPYMEVMKRSLVKLS